MSDNSWGYAASTGLDFTHDSIVDAHFRACRATYRRLLRKAGVQPGWHVLDAGCGAGSFLPWLAELVGPDGRITGVDLAPEHAEQAAQRIRDEDFGCHIAVTAGDLRDLPVADETFDAVWCANMVQYLDDGELLAVLREMRRVLRPGGVVAIKDLDAALVMVRPGDPFLFTDFFRTAARVPGYARQLLRSRELYQWLTIAGFGAIRQETVLIEHFAPFSAAVREFYGNSCAQLAGQAKKLGVPGEWDGFLDVDSPVNPLNDPMAYVSEGNVLALGVAD
jgi:ubiquinone/menaquinone biosynthesis C-methylase UbiE